MDHHDIDAMNRRHVLGALGAGALAGLLPASAAASDWPTRPVRIVIAVGAGSSGDILARTVAPRLETIWKQPVIVENKPGASGVLGTEYAIGAKDGHTLLLASQSSYLPKFTQANLRYDPLTDLVPIYRMINYEMVVATNGETAKKAKSFEEIVALGKSSDKGLFFGGLGPSSVFNVTMALVNRPFGMKYTPVDFSNVGAMNIAVIRNDAQLMVNTPSSIRAHFESGALVPVLAVNKQRYANLPNVPALGELPGFKGDVPVVWAGMVAPKGTPQSVIDRVAKDLNFVLHDPDMRKSIEAKLTGEVQDSSPAAFAKQIRDEAQAWKVLFASMNYKPQ